MSEGGVWFTLAVDQVEHTVVIAGFAETKRECRYHCERVDTPYVKTFSLSAADLGRQMSGWFRKCGMPSDQASTAVQDVGKELLKMFPKEKTS